MPEAYTTRSKVFREEQQKYEIKTKHFLFFNWKVMVPVDRPKNRLIVFVQEADNIEEVSIQQGRGDPIVVSLKS